MTQKEQTGTGITSAGSRRSFLKAAGTGIAATGVLGARTAARDGVQGNVEWGDRVELGNGTIRTFVSLTRSSTPRRIGVEFTGDALDGLPEVSTERVLQFPDAVERTPFEWFLLNWNPGGHAPAGIYGVPHFDFHFYTVTEQIRDEIRQGNCERAENEAPVTCETFSRGMTPLPDDQMPSGYQLVPAIIPRMGNHLTDPTALEFTGTEFTHTFIWGAFDGRLVFFEPMITKEFFEQRSQQVRTSITMPEAFPRAGQYPTRYVVEYRRDRDAHRVALTRFRRFEASIRGIEGGQSASSRSQ